MWGPGSDPCTVPMVVGSGTAALGRWYYEAASRTCRPFTYRGLYGNENNFVNKEACEAVSSFLLSSLPIPLHEPWCRRARRG